MGGDLRPSRLRRRSRQRTAFALALALLLLAATLAAAAGAQTPDPGQVLGDPGKTTGGADTEQTPVAKSTELWTRIGGAKFGEHQVPIEGSPTPLSADLFAVSFRNLFNGFIGGDRCEDPEAEWDELDSCTRVPVIYRYSQEAGRPGEIEESLSASGKGYVAAIAWLDPDRALAVGGTGDYPRREPAAAEANVSEDDPGSSGISLSGDDPAGDARAWLYEGGSWEELDLPDGMGALTAVDVSPDPSADCGADVGECAFVGGLREIWKWQDGSFTEEFTPSSIDDEGKPTVTGGSDWLFRVRQLRFSPEGGPAAVAVTSGCCDLNPANDVARVLVYNAASGRWDVRLLFDGQQGAVGNLQTLPDSYYAFTWALSGRDRISVVATPGGPKSDGEPASRIVGPLALGDNSFDTARATSDPAYGPLYLFSVAVGQIAQGDVAALAGVGIPPQGNSDVLYELSKPNLSTMRLNAGDGDVERVPLSEVQTTLGSPERDPDGLMDWAVGVLRSSDQGIAYTSAARAWGLDPPKTLDCPGAAVVSPDCKPNAEATQEDVRSRALLALPTYALNGFQLIGSSGIGWAVGDKGAVVRLGGEGTVGSNKAAPPKPALGSPKRVTPPASQPYDPLREGARGTGPAGPVPALGQQDLRPLDPPGFVASGSPDTRFADQLTGSDEDVEQIVMSRDGSEGWAIGPGGSGRLTLHRYTGDGWERCRAEPTPDVLEADAACAELAPLRKAGVRITAAARVPLERDSDPTNDDELEIVAAGSTYSDQAHPAESGQPEDVILRYRGGRWTVDWAASQQIGETSQITDVAFIRPDDGWMVAKATSNRMTMYRFEGSKWNDCKPLAAGPPDPICKDPGGLLPFSGALAIAPPHLAVVGERVYLYGTRQVGADAANDLGNSPRYPLILYRDPDGSWRSDNGGYDPGRAPEGPDPADQGELLSLSVVQRPDGGVAGWAVGKPPSNQSRGLALTGDHSAQLSQGIGPFLRLDGAGGWVQTAPGRVREYLPPDQGGDAPRVLSFLDSDGEERAILALATTSGGTPRPLLTYEDGDWRVQPTPFTMADRTSTLNAQSKGAGYLEGEVRALAADGRGGFWMAAVGHQFTPSTYFYRWADAEPGPVFEDVPHPIRETITSAAAGPEGRLWVTTASDRLYVHDRVTGWDAVKIGGWDRGRVVTNPSTADAVAVGADGSAVVVGENGRIAEIDPGAGVTLDPAASLSCGESSCSGTQDLHSAAVASDDGSAMVGGEQRSLAWRSGTGDFHTISSPPTSLSATITGISMPDSGQAWLATNTGDIFRGEPGASDWTWQLESVTEKGDPLAVTLDGKRTLPLNGISVDADGYGYAVGDDGVILERDPGGGAAPWRRIESGHLDDLQSLSYAPGGGTLIGGESGLILTGEGGTFRVARQADYFDPFSTARSERNAARMVAVTATPGPGGAVEAWAVSQASSADGARSPAPGRILHYSSDPSNPLLSAASPVEPLADAPAPGPEDLTLAAFGKSDCQLEAGPDQICPEPTGSNLANEVVADRVRDQILSRSQQPGGPQLALFTGDVDEVAGSGAQRNTLNSPLDPSVVHHRWVELVGRPFAADGVPLFGAIGAQDLSHAQACTTVFGACASSHETRSGTNLGWREALAEMSAPWGSAANGDGSIVPVPGSAGSIEGEDVNVSDPTGAVGDRTVSGAGAHTHYAFDFVKDGERLARVVVVDSSLRALAASDPLQNPLEAGSQVTWLSDVLCQAPATTTAGQPCTREPGERAIVVSNTPSYSYDTQASNSNVETALDSAVFERTMLENKVDLVVSGRLGWNGLYYTCSDALHHPQPGESYPAGPPKAGDGSPCGQVLQTPPPGVPNGLFATVVASSAGGKLAGSAPGSSAPQGYWRGYTIVHLDGETGEVSVEQRPVFDWIGIVPRSQAQATHVLRAGKKLALLGYGREPVGMDAPARYDDISSPAITHRYDLLVADEAEPWLPAKADGASAAELAAADPIPTRDCSPYLCLDPRIGRLTNEQAGEVKAGNGKYPRTYGIVLLSAGDQTATWPLVFEPRASFKGEPEPPPPPPSVPLPDPPTVPTNPTAPTINLPAAPALPILAAPSPLPPPAPPAPPTFASKAPLDLNVAPTSLDVPPPTAVTQPPTPPVNPAPPGGARREARQRQAAAQKSGADSGEGAEETQDAGGDLAESPNAPGTAMTRHQASRRERGRPSTSLTAVSAADQPSAWARDVLLGGGLGVAALILALATARPTPRRREPKVPAPAWARRPRR